MSTIAGVPNKIKIRREEGYHTHHIGKTANGMQFMGFIVGTGGNSREPRADQSIRWYAVLYHFDADGNHQGTKFNFLGKKSFASELNNAESKLVEMIRALGKVTYCDVQVKLFSVRHEGVVFGLMDASIPEKGYARVDLAPNGLAFFAPWDGTYET
jgi:hypothetical protein